MSANALGSQKKVFIGFPGSGVTGICEPSDVVTGNQTEVLCKSNASSKY